MGTRVGGEGQGGCQGPVCNIPLDSLFLLKVSGSLAGPSKCAVIKGVDSMFTIRHSKVNEQWKKSCSFWREKRMSSYF